MTDETEPESEAPKLRTREELLPEAASLVAKEPSISGAEIGRRLDDPR